MTGVAGRIPVRIEAIEGSGDDVVVFMDIDDFMSSGASLVDDMAELKASYLEAVKAARRAGAPARAGGRVGTRRRWAACKILADFDRAASGKFEVVNYREAYARGLGVPPRRVRACLGFGSFSDGDVLDEIPFGLYAELALRLGALRRAGRLEAEKARLVGMGRSGRLPTRDAYRRSLREPPAG